MLTEETQLILHQRAVNINTANCTTLKSAKSYLNKIIVGDICLFIVLLAYLIVQIYVCVRGEQFVYFGEKDKFIIATVLTILLLILCIFSVNMYFTKKFLSINKQFTVFIDIVDCVFVALLILIIGMIIASSYIFKILIIILIVIIIIIIITIFKIICMNKFKKLLK